MSTDQLADSLKRLATVLGLFLVATLAGAMVHDDQELGPAQRVSASIVSPDRDGRIIRLVRGESTHDLEAGSNRFWSAAIEAADNSRLFVIKNAGARRTGWDPGPLMEIVYPAASEPLSDAVVNEVLTESRIQQDPQIGKLGRISEFDAVSKDGERFLLRLSFKDPSFIGLGVRLKHYPFIYDRAKDALSLVVP